MKKLRARSRSFSNSSSTHKEEARSHHNGGAGSSKDDIDWRPNGSNKNNNTRIEFPLELARSLQIFTASLSPPSASRAKGESRGKAPNRPLPPPPLKPILRSSASAGAGATESKQAISAGPASKHCTSSSVSSTGSSKQISFLLPESPTRPADWTTPEPRHAAASAKHSRGSSASSTTVPSDSFESPPTSASTTSQLDIPKRKSRTELPVSAVLPPRTATRSESDILHIVSEDIMHVRKASDEAEGRRCSLESLSKDLPPLPLHASAPASSATLSSRKSSRQSGHTRGESASSAASSVLSNPIHLPRLKLGEPSLGFPVNPFAASHDSSRATRATERSTFSPLEDGRFAWMGFGKKRDSAESKRSSKRRSDSSVIADLHSIPMNQHQRSRSSQLDVVLEMDPADVTLQPGFSAETTLRSSIRPSVERNLSSCSKDKAAAMTQIWVSLLEDFVLLCDDPSMPSSQRSSSSSLSSGFVAPPSPSQGGTSDFLLPPVQASSMSCPTSPSPSSECDPFLRLPPFAGRKYSTAAKPLPPSPIPSLEVDGSTESTTTTYTHSPCTPGESESPPVPCRSSFNPFEASFTSIEGVVPSATSPTSTSHTRWASMPGTLSFPKSAYSASRPEKQRPPPLQLSSPSDSNDSMHTAVPPQTEAQTHFYKSQRSRSLPTSSLGPVSHRQPISPSKRDLEAEQLGASTSSTGSNRTSRRYHFPSSYGAPLGAELLKTSTANVSGSSRRRNKSIDEGYSGTGLTPTPTSDTFSIPSRSREASVSSTSEGRYRSSRRRSSCNTAGTEPSTSPASSSLLPMESERSPENSLLSKSQNSGYASSNTSTPIAKRYTESTRITRSKRSQSASEHVRKRSSSEAVPMKRSPTLEIVMYGVAL